MTPEDKQMNLLGLALRAGKLITGEDLTIKAIQNGKAKLVVVATTASDNTREKLTNKCLYYNVPLEIAFTSDEISSAIGKSRSICAFTDKGFANSYLKLKGTNTMK
ncbi:putative ribosomal protein YlxQ [Jeotgalibaca dankookensis]|uniref:Putative ribosomal protein YlxQ n=1 Tax=Jeotgalibaca dankookensis TaxID=708126 RepID=A0A1S6INR7_9LACT|nr:ribosomal L7Ae/L30e/S12e/Gadd45 family protein [Jeotgalibaca dankookensis]AQS53192.1 putative ribosomal protein YlxQ [Jeotgalibaca dankookensis]